MCYYQYVMNKKGVTKMKEGIHPQYEKVTIVRLRRGVRDTLNEKGYPFGYLL